LREAAERAWERVLVSMHNLSIIGVERAKTLEELSGLAGLDAKETLVYLSDHERYGYVGSKIGLDGVKRYFLTGLGVIRVCSLFS